VEDAKDVSVISRKRLKPDPKYTLRLFTIYITLPIAFFSISFLCWPIIGTIFLNKAYAAIELGENAVAFELIIFSCFALKFLFSLVAFLVPEISTRLKRNRL